MSVLTSYIDALLSDARCFRCLPEKTQWEIQTYIIATVYAEFGVGPNELAQRAKCLACLGRRNLLELRAYLLTYLNGTYRFPDGMIQNARCFDCIPQGMQGDVHTYLFTQDPSWSGGSETNRLAQIVKDFQALSMETLLQIQVFILATLAEISTDPNVLMEYAICMRCVPDPMLEAIVSQALEYMMPVPPTSPRATLDPPPVDEPRDPPTPPGGCGRGGCGGGGGNGRGGGLPSCTDDLTSLIPVLTPTYNATFDLTTATAFIPRNCCKGGIVLVSGSDDYEFATGNIITTVAIPARQANYTTAPIDLSAGGYDYYRARVICNDGILSDWSNIIAAHWIVIDSLDTYTNGSALNGLNGGVNFVGAYVDRATYVGVRIDDSLETYTSGSNLNGLNGGTGFSGAYTDRTTMLGQKAYDSMESYADGAGVSGLNGGTGWAGAYAV